MAKNLGGDFEAEAIADAGIKLTQATIAAVSYALPVADAFVQESGTFGQVVRSIRASLPSVSEAIARNLAACAVVAAKKYMTTSGSSASRSSTLKKKKRHREASVPAIAAQTEPPLRLAALGTTPKLKSVWASLREMVSAKRRINNCFSFKISSNLDQRGLLAIPLRHDGDMKLTDTVSTTDWIVGTQGAKVNPATTLFPEYVSMLQDVESEPDFKVSDKRKGVLIPRLNLPTLEDCSWNLNQLKLVQNDMGGSGMNFDASSDQASTLKPIYQLGGGDIAYSNDIPKSTIISAKRSAARLQEQLWMGFQPLGASSVSNPKSFPKFKTQLRGGSFKMRCVNQGMDRTTIEYVVLKVKDPNVGVQTKDSSTVTSDDTTQFQANNIWKTLYETVGYEHCRKVGKTGGYPMGSTAQPDVDATGLTTQDEEKFRTEVLSNPYHSWLPSSLFKAKYPIFKNDVVSDTGIGVDNVPATSNFGANQPDVNTYMSGDDEKNSNRYGLNKATEYGATFDQTDVVGAGGQPVPFRVAGRGHCTIAAGGERNITIPLPGSTYDASRICSVATLQDPDDDKVILSDESYVVLMSVNGAMTDMILPGKHAAGETSDLVKVIGQAYAPTTVDVYCSYTENVAPSHCDYSQIPTTQLNMGNVRNPMLPGDTPAYPGRILSMAGVQPISTNGVVRTGDTNRAAEN